MNNISADGAWRWNGSAWVPNDAEPLRGPAFAEHQNQSMHRQSGASEVTIAAWSHYGPLIAAAASVLLTLSIIGSTIAWLGLFAFAIPLYIRSDAGRRSRFVYAHATESLNFQLTWLLFSAVCWLLILFSFGILLFVLVLPMLAASIFMIVAMVKAGMAASRGEYYRYPLCIHFV